MRADKQKIEEILSRSVAQVLPSKEKLKEVLLANKKCTFYVGADATGPELHIGHATNFILLERLRRLGHEVIVLFGDFTAQIGDPSGKESTRKQLSQKEIQTNIKTWKSQAGKILDFNDVKNPARIEQNAKWYKKMDTHTFLSLAARFTVGQMLERDMFQKRLKEEKPIYLHEFLYPLLQGYDSVWLNVDGEIGGTDQTFNMLMGRTLQKIYNQKEKFVITTTLLENPATKTKLMSKSEGNYIALSDTPEDMFGKAMALPDQVVIQVLTDCTWIPMGKIHEFKTRLKKGENPRDIKIEIAFILVETYHDTKKAKKAKDWFIQTFQKEMFPGDAEEIQVKKGTPLCDILLKKELIASKNEFKRLILGGAIHDTDTKTVFRKEDAVLEENTKLRIGKKRFLKVTVT